MKEYIKRALRSFARKGFGARILRFLIQVADENRLNMLMSQLKKCGNDVTMFMPIIIQNPEKVEIGNQVSIAPFVHMWGGGGIKIGDRVMIASHCAITSLSHDYKQENMNTTQTQGEININDDVWIGAHSVAPPGVTIGRGAVVWCRLCCYARRCPLYDRSWRAGTTIQEKNDYTKTNKMKRMIVCGALIFEKS